MTIDIAVKGTVEKRVEHSEKSRHCRLLLHSALLVALSLCSCEPMRMSQSVIPMGMRSIMGNQSRSTSMTSYSHTFSSAALTMSERSESRATVTLTENVTR